MKKSVKKKLDKILKLSIYMLLILVAVLLVSKFILLKTVVVGESMSPTLSAGDQLLTDRLSYRFKTPERFDIIVFPYRHNRNELVVKRVIGMPGEKIEIIEGSVFINDKELTDKYGNDKIRDMGDMKGGRILAADEYFVLGDNRNDSIDSRFDEVGAVRADFITGKIVCRLKPLDRFGSID